MPGSLKVACAQMMGVADRDLNLERAEALVERAAAGGADVVVLPEHWDMMGDHEQLRRSAEDIETGVSAASLCSWAKRHGVAIVGGSTMEAGAGHDRVFNTCVSVDREGAITAVYRKIHLFDVDVGGVGYHESALVEPGDRRCTTELEDWKVGLTVCYDLRFPELYRDLALDGAELITVPANFTAFTGRDHWEVLLRARAIENQLYIAAAAQYGESRPGKPSYGRSLICNPWGTVLAQAADEETVIFATIERAISGTSGPRCRPSRDRVPKAYGQPEAPPP